MSRAAAERGFALVSAIFLLVVLAMLGALMVSLSNSQHIGSARDLLATRAEYAARGGLEWGAYQALQANSCPAASALPNALAATGFGVQVACVASGPYDEAGVAVTLYQITATASTGSVGAHDFAERQMQVLLSKP